jgi:hypothetical protein
MYRRFSEGNTFSKLLSLKEGGKRFIVLDGGLSTSLQDVYGLSLSDGTSKKLWSAR